jgi:hypothetical protein
MKNPSLKLKNATLLLLFAISLLASCSHDETVVSPRSVENEFLTTVHLRLVSRADGNPVVTATRRDTTLVSLSDTDSVLNLTTKTIYDAEIIILDETKTPSDTVSKKIKERANIHQIFFFPDGSFGSNLTIDVTDQDTNNPPLPIGLRSIFTTVNTASGNLRVVLKHQPNSKRGSFADGSSDFDINFKVNIN